MSFFVRTIRSTPRGLRGTLADVGDLVQHQETVLQPFFPLGNDVQSERLPDVLGQLKHCQGVPFVPRCTTLIDALNEIAVHAIPQRADLQVDFPVGPKSEEQLNPQRLKG